MHTCCFLGHREICQTEELHLQLYRIIEKLIVEQGVDTFLFGSKSGFNRLCYRLVTEMREIYPYIKRIYVRAEFPVIEEAYKAYLLEHYEDTYYPNSVAGAAKASYIKRNMEMVDRSQFCVFYYNETYIPPKGRSGTKIAFDYAVKHNKRIFQFPLLHTPDTKKA